MISIIIVTFNHIQDTINCIQSVLENIDLSDKEIIVADNNSRDGTAEKLKEQFDKVRIIENKENIGFGKANNIAAAEAKGEYLLFINNDTIVNKDSIDGLINFISASDNPVIAGGKVYNPDLSPQIIAGREINLLNSLLNWGFYKIIYFKLPFINNYWINTWEKDEVQEVERISGCYFAIRKEYFESIGGFDEKYFMYYEDTDLCKRFRLNSGLIYYYPFSSIIHIKGNSSSSFGKSKLFLEEFQSMIYYLCKYNNKFKIFLYIITLKWIWMNIWFTLGIIKLFTFSKNQKINRKFDDVKFLLNISLRKARKESKIKLARN